MKIAMAQMSMTESINENMEKSMEYCRKAAGCDLLFFPEIQLTPFFPQYKGLNADKYCLKPESKEINLFREMAKINDMYISPNIYLEIKGKRYDTSLLIEPSGNIAEYAKMVHIAQAKQFYEKDYYTPSDDGFKVVDTPYGKIGIVICYDRHLPESIRSCTLMGADLIIIPTANTKAEPMEMFEWEIRVQAMQNQVFIAMCNRVGTEGEMDFSGQSIVVDPYGDILVRADENEQLICMEADIKIARKIRKEKPYIESRRKEMYYL